MKTVFALLALISLGCAAPQQRKVFHENVEDFLTIIEESAGEDLIELLTKYLQFDEFQATITYIRSFDFESLILEMESLPEFKAIIDFLEKDNIDISYFLDRFNGLLEHGANQLVTHSFSFSKNSRIEPSGRDLTSFIKDSINLFPKDELSALFDQKMADDEEFKAAVINLMSEELLKINDALWNNEQFLAEVETLNDNGINIGVLFIECLAIFGQN